MGVTGINKILLGGDKTVAKDFMGQANSQMGILKQEMSFQNLKQGVRRVQLYKNVWIECRIIFDYHECEIWVDPVSDEQEYGQEHSYFVIKNGSYCLIYEYTVVDGVVIPELADMKYPTEPFDVVTWPALITDLEFWFSLGIGKECLAQTDMLTFVEENEDDEYTYTGSAFTWWNATYNWTPYDGGWTVCPTVLPGYNGFGKCWHEFGDHTHSSVPTDISGEGYVDNDGVPVTEILTEGVYHGESWNRIWTGHGTSAPGYIYDVYRDDYDTVTEFSFGHYYGITNKMDLGISLRGVTCTGKFGNWAQQPHKGGSDPAYWPGWMLDGNRRWHRGLKNTYSLPWNDINNVVGETYSSAVDGGSSYSETGYEDGREGKVDFFFVGECVSQEEEEEELVSSRIGIVAVNCCQITMRSTDGGSFVPYTRIPRQCLGLYIDPIETDSDIDPFNMKSYSDLIPKLNEMFDLYEAEIGEDPQDGLELQISFYDEKGVLQLT